MRARSAEQSTRPRRICARAKRCCRRRSALRVRRAATTARRPDVSSRAHPAVLTVASFPPALPENPYLRLLHGALAEQGVETVEGAPGSRWALRARSRVDAVHLHWIERYVHARDGL